MSFCNQLEKAQNGAALKGQYKPTRLIKSLRPGTSNIRLEKEKRKKATKIGKKGKKEAFQPLGVIQSPLLEINEKTLARLLVSIVIKIAITHINIPSPKQ